MNTITKMKNIMKTKILLLLLAVFTISGNAQTFDWETANLYVNGTRAVQSLSSPYRSVVFTTPNGTPINLSNVGQGTTGLSVRNAAFETVAELEFHPVLDIQSIIVFALTNNQDWIFTAFDGSGNVLNTTTATVNTTASVVTLNFTNVTKIEITKPGGLSGSFGVDDIVFTPFVPCTVTIPDANFKSYLVGNTAINTNGDTEIQCSEATAFTGSINVYSHSISDLTGIEAFTALTFLNCGDNSLNSLNVSQNTALTALYCHLNSLTALDTSNNIVLTQFACNSNALTSLNVANGNNTNIATNSFFANNNPNLTCITVDNVAYSDSTWSIIDAQTSFSTNCTACIVTIPDTNFKTYLVGNTAINTNGDSEIQCSEAAAFAGQIDVSNLSISDMTGIESFTNLTDLNCSNNLLTSLNINSNTNLLEFRCNFNSITVLDFSNNSNLLLLSCQNNSLTTLNIANGNNTALIAFDATNNPNLTCITVDNVAHSTANWILIDAQTSFSTNCTACIVTIPDANFKTYLVGNTAINTNGDTEIQCSEATAFTGIINVNGSSISDLTGVEAFTALAQLDCSNNQLTSLDVSSNTALEYLHCDNNQLTSLDVSSNTTLVDLRCYINQLTSLDVSQNTNLTSLYCGDNQLSSLDVSSNTNLTRLYCGDSQLSSLNLANGNNSNFIGFYAVNNPNLTCITVDDVAYSTANWTLIDAQTNFSTNCNAPTTTIAYVNHAVPFGGVYNGTTWANAYGRLEDALAAATDGSEIWIATGTYLPNTSAQINTPFSVNNADLKIYGGFAGTETQLSDRVLGTNETILSGDFQGNDVFVNDHFTNSLYHSSKTDNSRNIINITALANNLVLDGLTISNAHNSVNNIEGSAIIKEKTVAKLTIQNCIIKNNIAALAASGIFAKFELNNVGGTRGELIIKNSKFINNMSRYASGVYAFAITNTLLDIKVENSLFNNNIAGNRSTGVRGLSGSASWFRSIGASSNLDLKLINNTYVNNIDDSDGNGINNNSRAVVAINTSNTGVLNAEVVNCIFWNNYKPTSTSTITVRSITNTYQDAAQSIVVKNSIDQLNFNDASITSTVNTSSSNPIFTNLNNDLTLQTGSPAIDTGDNSYVTTTFDLAGNQRIFNTTVDMGCYESIALLTYELTTNVVGSGSVTPSGVTTHNDGTVVNVTAIPATGWSFDGWSGASTSVNPNISITMDADKTLTANFSQVQYELTIIENDGTVTPDSGTLANGVYTYNGGTIIEITAVANTGFVFDHYEVTDSNGTTNNTANPLNSRT